jgi:hypothetical protein
MDDEYTIADISMLGWVRNLIGFYGAGELVAFDTLKHTAWLNAALRACGAARVEIPSGRKTNLHETSGAAASMAPQHRCPGAATPVNDGSGCSHTNLIVRGSSIP